jgi:predicted enzyme related to lactoylglutathione lyase
MNVPNLDDTLAAVEKSGGKCVVPKMPVPGVGWRLS